MNNLRKLALIVGLTFWCSAALAQLGGETMGQGDINVNLQVRVVTDNDRAVQSNLRVELTYARSPGTIAAGMTNSQGVADLTVTREGNFMLRITGPGIDTTTSDVFMISKGDGTHVEYVRVKLKQANANATATGNAVSSTTSYGIPKDAAKAFEQGVAELHKSEWKKAEEHFQAAVNIYPKFDQAYDSLGIAKQNGGDIAGAKAAYQKAIELNGHNAGAQRNLARVLEGEKDWAGAADLLTKSLAEEPNHAGSLTMLAVAQLEEGKVDEAMSNASRVHALEHKSYPMAHLVLARGYEMKGQKDDAIAQYKLYLTEDPTGTRSDAVKKNLAKLTESAK